MPFELVVDPTTLVILAGVAFLAGFIDAIAGGGGLLTIPALLTAGVPPHLALGTNKLSSTFGAAVASYTFYRRKLFQPRQWRKGLIATAQDRILLRQSEAGQRLAGVDHLRLGAGNRVSILACLGGYAGEKLQEIERRAFPGQHGARRTFDFADKLIGYKMCAILHTPGDPYRAVELHEASLEPSGAAQDGVFA